MQSKTSIQPERDLAIQVQGLTKSYGKVRALRGIDLEVGRGEIFGFLGPNGAGKTTTIRCLLDMIRPDGGKALLLGLDPQADPVAVQARTGYLPGEMQFYDNLTVERQLRFFSDMRDGRAEWGYVRQLAERLDLDLKPQIKNLSKGNKQKVGVIQALMHRPELLLLDEPTSGLDPLMQQEVLGLLREANAAGATVFFSSHIMSEVESVAGRVAIIRAGEIVEVAETESLTRRALNRLTVRFKRPVDVADFASLPGVDDPLPGRPGPAVTLQVSGRHGDAGAGPGPPARPGPGDRASQPGRGLPDLLQKVSFSKEIKTMKRLWTTFRYTFTGLRGQILGWGLGLALYGLMIVPMYDMLAAQQEQLQQMIASYPPEFLAFFGGDANSLITPAGFLGMYAFSMMPVIIGIFAVMAGSGLIVSDEERGRLDLIMAHPVGRTAFFFGRAPGRAGCLPWRSCSWAGWASACCWAAPAWASPGVRWLVPFLSLLVQTLVYVALALLLSMLLPSRSLAAMLTGLVMVASYFVSSLAFMDERLAALAKLMPYHYFQTVLSFARAEPGLAVRPAGRQPADDPAGLAALPAPRHPPERRRQLAPAAAP